MRRRVGMQTATAREQTSKRFQEIADGIIAKDMQELEHQQEIFKTNLEEFARKYRNDIRKDPTFRNQFQKMCTYIGVDPLASNKGFWADLLGIGDFYYELSVQIIEVCISTRPRNGGLIDISELKRRVEEMRGGSKNKNGQSEISDDDIARSIKTLKPLSSGFEIIKIGSKRLVRSVPKELDTDQSALLVLGQRTGYVTSEMIRESLKWQPDRIYNALQNLLQDGYCWIDKQTGGDDQYWIPSYFGFDD